MAERKSRTDKKSPASTAGNDVARASGDGTTQPEPKGETRPELTPDPPSGVACELCGRQYHGPRKFKIAEHAPPLDWNRATLPDLGLRHGKNNAGHMADVLFESGYFGNLTPAQIAVHILAGRSLGLDDVQGPFDLVIGDGPTIAYRPGQPYAKAGDDIEQFKVSLQKATGETEMVPSLEHSDRITPEPASPPRSSPGIVIQMPGGSTLTREDGKHVEIKAGETVTFEGVTTGTGDAYTWNCAVCGKFVRGACQYHFTNKDGLQEACSEKCRNEAFLSDETVQFPETIGTPDTMPEHCPVCMSTDQEKFNGPEPCKDLFHYPYIVAKCPECGSTDPHDAGPVCLPNEPPRQCENLFHPDGPPEEPEETIYRPRDDENGEPDAQAGPVPETLSGAQDRENSGQFESVGDVLAAAGMSEAEIQQRTANAAVAREQARVAEAEEQAIASIAAAKIVEAPDGTKFDVSDLATPDQASGSVTPEPASPADNAESVVAGPPLTEADCSIYRETIVDLLRELGYDNDAIRERLNKFDVSTDDEKRELVVNYGNFYASKTDAIRNKVIEQLALDGKPTTELQKGFLIFAAVPTNPDEWTYAQALKAFQALSDYKR